MSVLLLQILNKSSKANLPILHLVTAFTVAALFLSTLNRDISPRLIVCLSELNLISSLSLLSRASYLLVGNVIA